MSVTLQKIILMESQEANMNNYKPGRPKRIKEELNGEDHSIDCPCGYSWFTKSDRMYVSCPNCLRKCFNPINKFKEKGK